MGGRGEGGGDLERGEVTGKDRWRGRERLERKKKIQGTGRKIRMDREVER